MIPKSPVALSISHQSMLLIHDNSSHCYKANLLLFQQTLPLQGCWKAAAALASAFANKLSCCLRLWRKYPAMTLQHGVLVPGYRYLCFIFLNQVYCFSFLDTIISLLLAQVPFRTLASPAYLRQMRGLIYGTQDEKVKNSLKDNELLNMFTKLQSLPNKTTGHR